MAECPATYEAVAERDEEAGYPDGCPICGRSAESHRPPDLMAALAESLRPENIAARRAAAAKENQKP